jgi:ABC-2 type transport system ATP-binding protein
MRVTAGEIFGFLGPNGAGKTTAMKILTCTLAPTEGRAAVAGFDVVRQSMAVRRASGFMPEHVPLYPDNTVRDFLVFVARLKGVPAVRQKAQLDAIVERTGLQEVQERLVGHLSKGYRQRVGMAQALIGDPPILILDEPSAGLDPHQIVEIRNLIRDFRGQKTVLLSSHILNEVSLICERVLILHRGRLVAEEAPAVLAARSETRPRVILAWNGAETMVRSALLAVPGVAEVIPTERGAEVVLSADPAEVRPLLAEAVMSRGGRLQQLEDRAPSLEDLFLQLTGHRREEQS